MAPLPHVRFCLLNRAECVADDRSSDIALDDTVAWRLASVNTTVNRAIRPVRKVARPGSIDDWRVAPVLGDCNDYAVTKRHLLIAAGLPASALALAVVHTRWGEGHLVLLVRTDRGDYVLDNLTDAIRPWSATGHRFEKIASRQDPQIWVAARPFTDDTAALGQLANPFLDLEG